MNIWNLQCLIWNHFTDLRSLWYFQFHSYSLLNEIKLNWNKTLLNSNSKSYYFEIKLLLKEYCIVLLKSHSMILKLSQLIYMPVTRAETFHSLLNLHTIPWELLIWACDIDNSTIMFQETRRLWIKPRMLKAKAYFQKREGKWHNNWLCTMLRRLITY